MRLRQRLWRLSGMMVLGFAAGGWQGPASAGMAADCAAINRGALDADLNGEASATRKAVLKAGERLTVTFEAATPGPIGTVTVRESGGASRLLLAGPGGTGVTLTAPKAGPLGFRLARDGAEPASFKVSCVPAGGGSRATSAAAAVRRTGRGAKLFDQPLADIEGLAVAELAGVVLDGGAPPLSYPHSEFLAMPSQTPSVPPAPAGVEMTMKWRDERYRLGGPDGLELDHSRSGVDAAVSYKPLPDIMIGALAQVDQPGEALIEPLLDLSAHRWIAGPVATIKLAPSLSLDARAAWGMADNGDPLSARATAVPRRAVSAKLATSQSFGSWRFSPSVSIHHVQEESGMVGGETHDAGAPHVAGFGRVDVAPEIAYRIDLDRSLFIEPRAIIGGFWAVDDLSRLTPAHSSHGDMRFKAEAGVTVGTGDGTKLQATGSVEEGEPGMADVWSGRLQLSVPMR